MRIIFLLLLLFNTTGAGAQVYVQLELFNDPKALKYTIGDRISYQVTYNPGEWNKGRIEQILVDENTLILDNAIVRIEDVTDFMLYRNSIKYLSGSLQTFGVVWLVQGAIAATFGENTSWTTVLGIGAGSYIGGWLLRKILYKIPIKLNDKNRLRIIDTRFMIPEKS